MLPSEHPFVKPLADPSNYALPIPIVSLPACRSSSTPPSSESVTPSSAPAVVQPATHVTSVHALHSAPHLPREPAVLGCATGQVRRMRSVLDMKLGAMATSLDASLSPDPLALSPPNTTLPTPAPHPPAHRQRCASENVPDKNQLSLHARAHMVDAFGIAIPHSTQRKMRIYGVREPVCCRTDDGWEFAMAATSPAASDDGCSIVLADSPSTLDLSALMC
ncbi:hypothetical protein BWQ96_02976 [Gracilariopsis chorda]|uniref:Uncharacterized protein n=1 Tax=Gracilariopsis chorda TaxID=448386 RepID=A0A2V3IYK2_9FLOR|nr:hypothetical protein BWQ96_02976 [Gracilariopsis chorda]|eukprot:PXF47201.1 hypothetical protein BWQ96_02976 [Gracilariopsis chorda]